MKIQMKMTGGADFAGGGQWILDGIQADFGGLGYIQSAIFSLWRLRSVVNFSLHPNLTKL